MEQITARIENVHSIELDNAFYVEDGKWIESLTVASSEMFDPLELVEGISGTELLSSREIPSGPSEVTVFRLLILANESYPFILGIILRQEAIPNRIVLQNNTFEVVATTRDWDSFRALADEIRDTLGRFELLSVNQIENPGEPLDSGRLSEVLVTKLAPEQLEVLETAYNMGYFDVPRQASATDVADALGIAQSTLSERLRVAERNLLELIYGPRQS